MADPERRVRTSSVERIAYLTATLVFRGWFCDHRGRWHRMALRHDVRDPLGSGEISSPYWTLEEAWAHECAQDKRLDR
jgi:hypothetical protein